MSPVKGWSPADGTLIVMYEGTKCSTYSVGDKGGRLRGSESRVVSAGSETPVEKTTNDHEGEGHERVGLRSEAFGLRVEGPMKV